MADDAPDRVTLTDGPGRVLTFFYGLLAISSLGRSSYQLVTQFHEAPTAYVLSAVAAVVYVVAFVAIIKQARRFAFVACTIELVGVLVVGTLGFVLRHDFPEATVWSGYGSGYGYLPLALPVLALLWLKKAPTYTPAPPRS